MDRWRLGRARPALGVLAALALGACAPKTAAPPAETPVKAPLVAAPAAPEAATAPSGSQAPTEPKSEAPSGLPSAPPTEAPAKAPEGAPSSQPEPTTASAASAPPAAKPRPPEAAGGDGGGRARAYWASSGINPDRKRPWPALAEDRLHDPRSEALQYLQEPAEALASLPGDRSGNFVNWVVALDEGAIAPRATAGAAGRMEILDGDVVFADTRAMPKVTFSHRVHTAWLGCDSCHPAPFPRQAGASDFTMQEVLEGRYCGICHGRVAFPLSDCFRCHNVGPRRGARAPR